MSDPSLFSRRKRRGRPSAARPAEELVAQVSAHGSTETTVTWRYVAVRANEGSKPHPQGR